MEIPFEGGLLRPWSVIDAEELVLIANHKIIADNLRDGFPNPYSIDDAHDWLELVLKMGEPARFFAIVSEDRLAGSIGIVTKEDIYRKNAEIGYFIAQDFWGKGLATKAVKVATAYAFKTFDIVRVYAEPFADNAASCRVLEKAGFTLEAVLHNNVIKHGIIKDTCIYTILKESFKP
jgi:ribosomal-protein-alanine N-acetyltransferase